MTRGSNSREIGQASKCLVWVCLALTLWSAYAIAAHRHSGPVEGTKCTLWVVTHSASPAAPSSLLQTKLVPVFFLLVEPVTVTLQRPLGFALTVRPPPEV